MTVYSHPVASARAVLAKHEYDVMEAVTKTGGNHRRSRLRPLAVGRGANLQHAGGTRGRRCGGGAREQCGGRQPAQRGHLPLPLCFSGERAAQARLECRCSAPLQRAAAGAASAGVGWDGGPTEAVDCDAEHYAQY